MWKSANKSESRRAYKILAGKGVILEWGQIYKKDKLQILQNTENISKPKT